MTAFGPLAIVVALTGVAFVRTRKRNSDLARLDWNVLVSKIAPLPFDVITRVAVDYLQPGFAHNSVNSSDVWELIGRDEGLQRLYSNSQVLMALACRATWDPDESFIAIEQMRRDAMVIRRAVVRLSLGLSLGYDRSQGPFSVQQAVSSYYLMRARVLTLYANHHGPRSLELSAVL